MSSTLNEIAVLKKRIAEEKKEIQKLKKIQLKEAIKNYNVLACPKTGVAKLDKNGYPIPLDKKKKSNKK